MVRAADESACFFVIACQHRFIMRCRGYLRAFSSYAKMKKAGKMSSKEEYKDVININDMSSNTIHAGGMYHLEAFVNRIM